MKAGQSLIVPRAPTLLASTARTPLIETASAAAGPVNTLVDVVPATDTGRQPIPVAERAAATNGGAGTTSAGHVTHRVKAGETLSSIARAYSTTVATLKKTNNLRSSTIQAGQRLSVPGRRPAATD